MPVPGGDRAVRGHNLLFALSIVFAAIAVPREVLAQTSPPTPPIIVRMMTVDDVVEPDGSYTSLFHVERLATNQSAAQKIAQQTVSYSESIETAEVVEAFTRKPDGKVLDVDRTQIFAQAPPGSPQVPMFTDRKQKVIVFPDVAPNDLVVFTIKQSHRPPFADQFFTGDVFPRGFAFEDARVSITLPKSMAAHVEVLGVDHRVDEAGESVTHRFLYKNPQPPVAAPAALSPWDTDPQFTVSTFADYAAVATAYRRTASAQAAVMPAVQALADEITAGTTDRREQAHLIYDWVSKHIRYVAIWLGNGGYVPHDAATILENRYGDCKDHVVLLESLLKAKGIASVAVLINTSNRYRLPEAATPGAFNHVLTYLPEFDLYVDSTAGVAPFGTLPAGEYGKPVAVAADTGSSLKTLPLVAPEENEETLQTTAELMTDGTVKGQSKTTATGPFGVTLRQVAAGIEAGGREHMAATQLRKFGWAGTGSYDFDPPRDDLISSYTVTASFDLEQRPELLEGKAFGPPTGLRLLVQPGEFLLGSWTLPKAEPTPCFSGRQVEELSLTLPPERDINSLPSGKTVEDPYLRYRSDWSREGQTVKVRREITVKLPVAVCREEIRAKLAEAIAEIRGDYRSTIALEPLVH
jgi:transglutaminase-like putative cysteine protease